MKLKYAWFALLGGLLAGCGSSSNGDGAPVNAAPTVGAVTDISIGANQQSQPIGFVVSDEQLTSLVIEVSSDNQQALPDSRLMIGGSGTDRTITVSPVIDLLGDALITIIVTDQQGLSASTSFLLTIDPEMRSIQMFARSEFMKSADDEPDLINAVEFMQDADSDDFADLLAP